MDRAAVHGRPAMALQAIAAVLVILLCAYPAESGSEPASIFRIERNKNRNQVRYGVHLDTNCLPVGDKPIYNYWLRLEEGPDVIKPIKFYQQPAYGFRAQEVRGQQIEVRLRALPERPITVRASRQAQGCAAAAYVEINGEQARLERVYVYADEGLLPFLPKVHYIDLFGESLEGAPVHERIRPD